MLHVPLSRVVLVAVVGGLLIGAGTAVAASKYVITSAKQISPGVLKSLRGKTGMRGAPGAVGDRGAPGPQGATGAVGPQGERGLDGAPGAAGPRGERGPSGGPAAHGTVSADGTVDAALSSGVLQVARVARGVYCVTIDPGRWTRGDSWPVLNSDYAINSEQLDSVNGAADRLVTLRYSSRVDCGGNSFRVVASRLDLDVDVDPTNGHQLRAVTSDEPFSFVLP
jgi:hypothetical protein